MSTKRIVPKGWRKAEGFEHGRIGQGALLLVAGQLGVDEEGKLAGPGLVAQFDQALSNACVVVRTAGGGPEDIVRITVYSTDLEEYRASRSELGAAWRKHMGRHYPAMSVIGVDELLRRDAVIELEATAMLPVFGEK
jgi:enamine deaminase RidA (YjgF/YER057c/UK114 family)